MSNTKSRYTRRRSRVVEVVPWVPKTELGKKVAAGS